VDRRLKKIERIGTVQKRLHQLAEWKLAQLDREKAELVDGQKALIEALNQDEHLQGLFVEAMARRLNALARETDRVNQARVAQNQRLVEEGLRLKRTERMSAGARREYRELLKKHGFETLLQTLAGIDKASLP
jgi:phosphoenolpyruvate synthase/pyruvate phosphate dikinase